MLYNPAMKTLYFSVCLAAFAAACSSSNAGGAGGSAGSAANGGQGGSAGSAASGGQGGGAASGGQGGSAGTAASGGQGGASGDAGQIDTYANFAQGFFQKYCVSCHAPGGSATPDLTQYANIVANKDIIRCGVASTQLSGCGVSPAPKQFPIGSGPKPTDAERNRLVAWIDAGLPK